MPLHAAKSVYWFASGRPLKLPANMSAPAVLGLGGALARLLARRRTLVADRARCDLGGSGVISGSGFGSASG